MSIIGSVGLGIPSFEINQTTVKQLVKQLFKKERMIERLLPIFDNAAIENRQFVVSTDWFHQDWDFSKRNELYIKYALDYSLQAIDHCLTNENFLNEKIAYEEIDMIIFVSSTGISTPSMDARIMNKRPFREDIHRLPIWGLGCAGGASGLARASDWTSTYKDETVLLICCELCSLTFQKEDKKKRNIVGTALFGDGVGAALVIGEHSPLVKRLKRNQKPMIKNASSFTKKDTESIMGWNVNENGLEVVFSKSIPSLIHSLWKPHLEGFLQLLDIKRDDIHSFIAHPGGKKVLEAMEEACSIPTSKFYHSYQVLKNHGNMSSPTVLYILKEWMKDKERDCSTCDQSILSALGPGFSSELLLLEWR